MWADRKESAVGDGGTILFKPLLMNDATWAVEDGLQVAPKDAVICFWAGEFAKGREYRDEEETA